jgi:hypothetical protein
MLLSVRSDLCNQGLYYKFYLNMPVCVILDMLHWLGLLVLGRSSVSRVVSVKYDSLGSLELPSIKIDLLLG